MGRINSKYLLLLLVLISSSLLFSAFFMIFISDKAKEIQKKQNRLLTQNVILKKQISKQLKTYEQLHDKISDIKTLIEVKSDNTNIETLLKKMTNEQKKTILEIIPNGYPLNSHRITSKFGYRFHPIKHEKRFHYGLDFGGSLGSKIYATAEGIVEYAGYDKGYGNLIIISHNFGFKTAYAHMLSHDVVKIGEYVKKGQIVGEVGNSGISTGPHLHYEIKYVKRAIDPTNFLNISINNFDEIVKKESKISWNSLTKAIFYSIKRYSMF
jgi:murein DD-endopeptidase MepM/ murein hydrolase activator NlpD